MTQEIRVKTTSVQTDSRSTSGYLKELHPQVGFVFGVWVPPGQSLWQWWHAVCVCEGLAAFPPPRRSIHDWWLSPSPGYVIRNCGRNQIISCPPTSAHLGSASFPQIGHDSLSSMHFIFSVFHLCLRLFPNSSALLFAILHLSLFLPKSLMQSPAKLYLPWVIVMSLTVLMRLLKQVVRFSSGSINKQVLTILSVFINLLLVA